MIIGVNMPIDPAEVLNPHDHRPVCFIDRCYEPHHQLLPLEPSAQSCGCIRERAADCAIGREAQVEQLATAQAGRLSNIDVKLDFPVIGTDRQLQRQR